MFDFLQASGPEAQMARAEFYLFLLFVAISVALGAYAYVQRWEEEKYIWLMTPFVGAFLLAVGFVVNMEWWLILPITGLFTWLHVVIAKANLSAWRENKKLQEEKMRLKAQKQQR